MPLNIKDLKITSSSFEPHGAMDRRHTHEGEDVSPALAWSGVPAGTRSFALICHDPDAPLPDGFTHWVVYGIPPDAAGIEEGGGSKYTEGRNDFGDQGYGGPLPPEGHGRHHYYFWVYALDTGITDGPGLTRREFIDRYGGNVLEQNRLVGTYKR